MSGYSQCTTLVTALYDIGRDKLTGKNAYRSFDKYLSWFKYVLWMNVPMVVFIPEHLESYVVEHRPYGYNTKIIVRSFEELSAHKYHDRIQETIDSMVKEADADHGIPSYFKECPEFITAKYETIVFSKFDFLKEVAHDNPFGTEYFIWLDAGTFYQEPPFHHELEWPDPYKIRVLGDKFLVSNQKLDIGDTRPLQDKRSYLRLNRNEVCAYILGGSKHAIDRTHREFWKEVDRALDMGVINNEQHILQLMMLESPEYYYSWRRTSHMYPNLPRPMRDRMIPAELACGTYTTENYPINPHVKLLAIATKEVPQSAFQRWEATAKYYGYDYEILGRDKSWEGFRSKTTIFCDKLKEVTAPYVVLTDCLDVFMTGSSDELYEKFLLENKDVIVGGELMMWYPKGNNDPTKVREYFEAIKEGPQFFPNMGFIMGKTSEMLKLITLHLPYDDDQGACFDTMYENKFPVSIDYRTSLVGNIPNYRDYAEAAINYFEYDAATRRYKSKLHGTTPVVLHFPGKNMLSFREFYTNTHSELAAQEEVVPNVGWVIFIVLVALILLIIMSML